MKTVLCFFITFKFIKQTISKNFGNAFAYKISKLVLIPINDNRLNFRVQNGKEDFNFFLTVELKISISDIDGSSMYLYSLNIIM